MLQVADLTSLNDFARYWDECIAILGTKPDMLVAGYIVNVVSNDHFKEFYHEGKGNELFVKVFDLAASLEIPNGITEIADDGMRASYWRQVRRLVNKLLRESLPR